MILLALGAHEAVPLGVPGEDRPQVLKGLDLLRRVNLGEAVALPGNVVVIGGGDAAFDAARTAARLGAESVAVLYRRSSEEMPASDQERLDAAEEGVEIRYLVAPTEITDGSIRCIRNRLGAPDASGRRRPEPIPGSEFELPADWVIVAIGQREDLHARPELTELLQRLRERALADESSVPEVEGVFAAGDALTGPQTLIDAIAGGRRAAAAIHAHLTGEKLPGLDVPPGRVDKRALYSEETILTRRQRRRVRPAAERLRDFEEVSLGFAEAQARAEAKRCLGCAACAACGHCGQVCIYGAIEIANGEPSISKDCDGCGLCTFLCPRNAIEMIGREEGRP